MKTTFFLLTVMASILAAPLEPALAGSFMHQSPKLYHRVKSPCRSGEVMKRTGGGGQDQVALQVLTTAREQLNAERLRAINALTVLVRSHELGIDAPGR